MNKRIAILLVALLVGSLIAGCSTESSDQTPAQPTQGTAPTQASAPPGTSMPTAAVPTSGAETIGAAARVNGQEIPLSTFQKQFFQFKVALTDQGVDPTSEEGQAAMSQVRAQVLNSLVELALIEQAAASMGIVVSDAEVEAKAQETIASGGADKFQAWLQESGITEEEFRQQLRSEMLTDAVIHQITESVPNTADQVHARHILVGTEQKAQDALRRVQSGEDFAAVARELSEDEITRSEGGDLGWFPKGMLSVPVEVEDAAFNLQAGQVSGIVRSPYGYHIIQVVERQQNRELPPEVYQIMKQKAFDKWLQDQRSAAKIEILVPLD